MSDYFAQLPWWKVLLWLVALGTVGGVILWHIYTGDRKPREPWDWK